jgi:hypothetical protein
MYNAKSVYHDFGSEPEIAGLIIVGMEAAGETGSKTGSGAFRAQSA